MKFLGQRPNIGLVVLIMSSGCLGCGGSGGTSGVGGAAGGMAGRLGSGGDGLGGSGAGSGGSGVSGSAGADAGSGGGSQPDAASSDGAVGTCYPACLESLLAQCPKTLVCTQQAYTSGQTFKCYTNGVIDETRPNQVERLKANGDFCLTIYTSTDVGDQYAHEDFFQGNGVPTVDVPVARLQLTAQANQYVVTCLADGSTADVDLTAPQCATYYAEQQQPCATGVCN